MKDSDDFEELMKDDMSLSEIHTLGTIIFMTKWHRFKDKVKSWFHR